MICSNNLIWTPILGRMTWAEAKQFAKTLSHGGYKDWRIPTVKELEGVLKKKQFREGSQLVWSSESRGKDCCTKASGWLANFQNKKMLAYPKGSRFDVRAVRNI